MFSSLPYLIFNKAHRTKQALTAFLQKYVDDPNYQKTNTHFIKIKLNFFDHDEEKRTDIHVWSKYNYFSLKFVKKYGEK